MKEIAEAFLSFPGARLGHAASDFIEIDMTWFDDEGKSWGGSGITADCSVGHIEAL